MTADTSDMKLGGRFWLMLVGVSLAIGIGGIILFFVLGAAWQRWGAIGALIFFGAVTLGVGYLYDRRQAKLYDDASL